MKRDVLAVAVASVVLFVWGFLSWAVIPWHDAVTNGLTDEAAMSESLRANAPVAGVYMLPFDQDELEEGTTTAFINVLPNGFETTMGGMMGVALIGQALSAALVLLLMKRASLPDLGSRVCFAALVGLAIGFISHFQYWNWFGFSTGYVLVIIIDTVIAWTLGGFVLAKLAFDKEADAERH